MFNIIINDRLNQQFIEPSFLVDDGIIQYFNGGYIQKEKIIIFKYEILK